ncbi:hypothetical protein M8J75_004210 [Diaphorina citri]|nr:hypothetical protein M8J75_004210 [Diaphorina citri]
MGFNYYAVLGLTRGASDYDIKMAFRKKAIQYNPERNNDVKSQAMFTLICEAYEVLSDKFRKAIYDQYGEENLKRGVVTPLGYVPPYEYDRDTKRTFRNFFGTESPFADLLNAYRPPKKQETSGDTATNLQGEKGSKQDITLSSNQQVHTVVVSLEELYRGCVKLLTVPVQEIDPCSVQLNIINTSKIVHIKIKPGLPEHTVFKFPKEPLEYSTSSEVIVITKDKPHDVFWREGADLHMKKNVSLKEALTGFSFTVTTLDDRILHIPITDLTTCNQSMKVIKSEGMPHVEELHLRGDLFIHLSIDYPKFLSPDLRKTLSTLLDEDKGKNNTTRQILDSKLKSKAGNLDF